MYKMKHMISEMRRGSTNESLFGIKYFMLTHLYCKTSFALHTPLYEFLCLDPHCIAFQISYISESDLNPFPKFRKSRAIWMS